MKVVRWLVPFVLVAMVAAGCGRDDGETTATGEDDGGTTTTTTTGDEAAEDAEGLDAGAFGDLGVLCQEGDPTPLTEETTGLTDTAVRVATFSDAGAEVRPGLNVEMHDTAEAVVNWCNEHGGINGRQIELVKRDAKLFEYQQRVIESCEQDFFMVGGGGVFDDTGQPDRLACGLPDIAGFMVTGVAAEADLHVQPIPNPVYSLGVGDLLYYKETFPEAVTKMWNFTGNLPATKLVAERLKEAGQKLGFEFVHEAEYNSAGEANWKPFLQAAQQAGAEGMFFTGEPENMANILQDAAEIGYELQFIRTDANMYTESFIEDAGDTAGSVFSRTVFYPTENADENEATRQYLELMERYKPDGKYPALLGEQSLSAWLLFLAAAGTCDEAGTFTRDCIYEEARGQDGWTAGGLHAPQAVPEQRASDCVALVRAGGTEWEVVDIGANEGPWKCAEEQVIELTGDYGEGARCPSGEEDPLPSTCAG